MSVTPHHGLRTATPPLRTKWLHISISFECTLQQISDLSTEKQRAQDVITAERQRLLAISHRIHAMAELSFQEHRSAALLRSELMSQGFSVRGVENVPTAFVASAGTGDKTIAICLEYDALPGVGHACGHNVIAAAGFGAALALARVDGIRILAVGCPAEEDGAGKALLIDAGVFDGVDAAMMVHPHSLERDAMATLALGEFRIAFDGGDQAGAVALMHLGIGQLRERMRVNERIHGIPVGGGACVWTVRAESLDGLTDLRDALTNIVEGAALMTSCVWTMVPTSPEYADLKTDAALAAFWRANAAILGRDSLPLRGDDARASTDMGNVSHVVPSIHPLLAIDAVSTIHQRSFAEAAVSDGGDQAAIDGAILLAWTAIDFVRHDSLGSHPGARR